MQLDFLGDLRRTHMCGELRAADAGKQVVLMGWVNRRRDLGNLIFIDLRDRTGATQIVFNRETSPALHEKAGGLRSEYVIAAIGSVKRREPNTINKNIATGEIEVAASELRLLNESKQPPFSPGDTALANEELRLKYRYIDLRRDAMQQNIALRHEVALAIRKHLSAQGFFEIETPFLTRSTPEGARDFLVPSRVHPGEFYALPQSPQLFKQILMISNCEKYFQIVRCFRDEDQRADRQLEFTQIDLEMSFPQQERVFEVVEGFLTAAFAAAGVKLATPFPRMTYDQAIRAYGSDKPDLRLPPMTDVRECFAREEREKLGIGEGLPIVAIRIPGVGELSRKERDDIKPLFGERKDAKLFEDFKRLEKSFPGTAEKIRLQLQNQDPSAAPSSARADSGSARDDKTIGDDDLIVLVAGGGATPEHKSEGGVKPEVKQHDYAVYTAAGQLRLELGKKYAERHKLFAGGRKDANSYKFLWVTDFPMFEWDAEGNRWAAAHHPFTSPHERDMEKVLKLEELSSVRANAYDIVLNGTELGSGSIRIHRQDVQSAIFRALGMSDDEARQRFGFFLEALEYGTPPHGGIALGLDRIVMILAGAESLREVIPFPKTARAVDLMCEAPTAVAMAQEEELELMSAWAGLSQKEWSLAHYCDELLRTVSRDLFGPILPVDSPLQQAMSLIVGKASNDARSAIRLAKAGYGVQSAGICRSVVEAAINTRYIEKEPDRRATSFLHFISPESRDLARRLSLHPVSDKVQKAVEDALKFEKTSGWPRSLRERAYDVEKPSYSYDVVFFMLSQRVHSTVTAAAGQLMMRSASEFQMRIGPSHDWVDTALATVFMFFYQAATIAYNAFGVSTDALNPLWSRFERFSREEQVAE